ncbi:hypothetical protein, secreted [gut metagenome]|uniref:Fimbrillin family protein n=1 Tax=gut metagenome TaxID=749906 RepID=J9C8J6_9ZZZZ
MKKIYWGALCLGAGLWSLTACSGSEDEIRQDTAAFRVESIIQGMARSPQLDATGAGSFVQGDVNTLFFQNAQGGLEQTYRYTYGATHYWQDLGLRPSVEGLKVSACYPPVETQTPHSYAWDVTNSQHPTPDFLAAPATAVEQNVTQQVNLKFKHLMHRLVVKLEADESTVTQDGLRQATLTLSQWMPVATLHLLKAEAQGATGTPVQQAVTGDQGTFILPPQPVGQIQLKVQVDQRQHTFRLSDMQVGGHPVRQLESGQSLTLTIRVSKGSFVITGQQIEGWGNQGEADGEIIL